MNGIVDLRDWNINEEPIIHLNGTWLLVPGEFVTPSNIHGHNLKPITVPMAWNDKKQRYSQNSMGIGTYSLKILLPVSDFTFSLKFGAVPSDYTLFINGKTYSRIGRINTDPDLVKPVWKPQIINDLPRTDSLELVLMVSNFNFRDGGITETVSFGTSQGINNRYQIGMLRSFFVLGALLIMAFYHFGLYFIRKEEKSTLYFGLLAFVVSVRLLFSGEHYSHILFGTTPFWVVNVLEYLSYFYGILLFLYFIRTLFPKYVSGIVVKVMTYVVTFISVLVITLPLYITSHLIYPFQIMTLIVAVYALGTLIHAVIEKNKEALIILAGLVALFLFVMNDILHSMMIINTGYYSHYGVFLFIFSQAFLLSNRYTQAF